jgi:hypothetical protein
MHATNVDAGVLCVITIAAAACNVQPLQRAIKQRASACARITRAAAAKGSLRATAAQNAIGFMKEVLGVNDMDTKLAWIMGAELTTATGANQWRLEGAEGVGG